MHKGHSVIPGQGQTTFKVKASSVFHVPSSGDESFCKHTSQHEAVLSTTKTGIGICKHGTKMTFSTTALFHVQQNVERNAKRNILIFTFAFALAVFSSVICPKKNTELFVSVVSKGTTFSATCSVMRFASPWLKVSVILRH